MKLFLLLAAFLTQNASTAFESGTGTMSSGNLFVSFNSAFASPPNCVCSELASVPGACGIVSVSTTSASLMVLNGGSHNLSWICTGVK